MESEMQSMYDNQVWILVDPPEGAKIIECKWIFKIKADNTFKGRLVVSVSPSPNTLYPDFIFDINNMRHCFIIYYSCACMI